MAATVTDTMSRSRNAECWTNDDAYKIRMHKAKSITDCLAQLAVVGTTAEYRLRLSLLQQLRAAWIDSFIVTLVYDRRDATLQDFKHCDEHELQSNLPPLPVTAVEKERYSNELEAITLNENDQLTLTPAQLKLELVDEESIVISGVDDCHKPAVVQSALLRDLGAEHADGVLDPCVTSHSDHVSKSLFNTNQSNNNIRRKGRQHRKRISSSAAINYKNRVRITELIDKKNPENTTGTASNGEFVGCWQPDELHKLPSDVAELLSGKRLMGTLLPKGDAHVPAVKYECMSSDDANTVDLDADDFSQMSERLEVFDDMLYTGQHASEISKLPDSALEAFAACEQPAVCPYCAESFASASLLEEHASVEHSGPRLCVHCSTKCLDDAELVTHTTLCHPSVQLLRCADCEVLFANARSFKLHQRVRHPGSGQLKCELCDAKFLWASNLREHTIIHHTNPSAQKLMMASSRMIAVCPVCGENLPQRHLLFRHMRTEHAGVKLYECHLCGQRLTTQQGVRLHVRTVHEGERRYACDKCPRRYGQHGDFMRHLRTHEAPRHRCDECGREFTEASYLRRHHRAVHVRILGLMCPECGKCFERVGAMNQHIRTVHQGERRFPCQSCDQKFPSSNARRRHTMAVHDGIKPHQCPVCNRTFTQAGNLRVHMKVHRGDRRKPYQDLTSVFHVPDVGINLSYASATSDP